MQHNITTILFDADGVVQETADDWHQAWSTLLADPLQLDDFLRMFLPQSVRSSWEGQVSTRQFKGYLSAGTARET
jgi:beta-phosphoglucomutase-like phosphatase (HAD superfamily)